jgi:hypothetical protein
VIIDNDGVESGKGALGGFLEGATINAVATLVVNGQTLQQTQQYTISYRANDGNDVSLAYLTTATAAEGLQITPSSIHPGQQVTLTGKLTDPDVGDFLTLVIDWGDGKTETRHPGTEPFAFTHRYAGNPPGPPQGTYTVHLTWFDQHNAGNSRDLAVTVQSGPRAAPGSGGGQAVTADAGGARAEVHQPTTAAAQSTHGPGGNRRDSAVTVQSSAPSAVLATQGLVQPDAAPAVTTLFTTLGLQGHGAATAEDGDDRGLLPLQLKAAASVPVQVAAASPGGSAAQARPDAAGPALPLPEVNEADRLPGAARRRRKW